MRRYAAIVWASLTAAVAVAGTGPSLTWLGNLNTSPGYAECHGVTNDGVVAGWAGVLNPHHAFRWTAAGGMEDLPTLGGSPGAEAWGLSGDGQVVVGISFIGITGRAVRWVNGAIEDLGDLGGGRGWAYGANVDGSVVVGASVWGGDGRNRAFRWTAATGMVNLGTLPGGIRSVARACSADGNVVVGWSGTSDAHHHAFRWENGVMTSISNPAVFFDTEALGVSGDGQVVVGAWGPSLLTPAKPFRWTAETGMVNLGTFPGGTWGEAWGANHDGSMVVGWSEVAAGQWRAFVWTQTDGMQDLNVLFADLLTDGSILWDAMAISPDGRYIAGHGIRPNGDHEAYLLDTTGSGGGIPGDLDGDGDVDLTDLSTLLAEFGCTSGCTADIDGDGDVDLTDLSILLSNFGT